MDINGIGAGPPAADFSRSRSAVVHAATTAGTVRSAGDLFVSSLQALSEVEITALLSMVDSPDSPQLSGRLDGLLRAAVAATADGDGNRAIGHLAEFAALSPKRAETLASLPSLSSIRGPVEGLVSRLTVAAKAKAETQLAQAVKLMESLGAKELAAGEMRVENLALIAGRLLDAGGYANFVWSAELSRLAIVPLPPRVAQRIRIGSPSGKGIFGASFTAFQSRMRQMWLRAPLLVLLLGWFAAGLVGGSFSALVRNYWPAVLPGSVVAGAFELWGVGFLALIGVALYRSARNVRF